MKTIKFRIPAILASLALIALTSCQTRDTKTVIEGDAASQTYVPPGEYDEFYCFMSGGYSGQIAAFGLPSGRMLKEIPVFSVYPENGYGYSEETKAMFNTSFGFVPWDDSHHIELSQTNGEFDGRWLFVNGNNTPRIARIDLTTFETVEILEIPDVAGLHCAPFITENSEYLVSGTRFSIPIPQADVPINTYKENFSGLVNYVKVDNETGERIRKEGFEFGATTGRPRRCGWIDLPAMKYAIMVNGVTELSMMKADVLDKFDTIYACTHYKINGEMIDYLPYDITGVEIEPVYEAIEAWNTDLTKLESYSDAPENLKAYVRYLEQKLEVPVKTVSVGPDRKQTLYNN